MTKTLAALGLLAMLFAPSPGRGQATELGEDNLMFSLSGQVEASEADATKAGFRAVSLGFPQSSTPDKVYWIGVVTALGYGDPYTGRDVLARLAGRSPNLLVSAKASVRDSLQKAVPGSRVSIQGILDAEARTYMVGTVQISPPGAK